MNRTQRAILALLLLVLLVAPRLPKLDSFVTLDEPFWLSVGGNFYYALGQRQLENTVYEYHPAVTTMWIVTGAFLAYFPQFRGFGQGYFDVDKNKFDPFLQEHGISPLYLLYLGRLIQVAVIIVFALVIYHLLSRLIGEEKAFLVTALASSAPYFLGHSRVLSHESMLAFFVLTSIFAMLAYLEIERKWIYLFISAASAALAQLTKSSAMAMIPVIVIMPAVSLFAGMKDRGFGRTLVDYLKILVPWFLVLVIAYIVLWPGMWVAPGKMLYEVYGNAFSYAFQGARLQVTEELDPSRFNLAAPGETLKSFVSSLIWYATPLTWVGVILAGLSFFWRLDRTYSSINKKLVLYLVMTAFLFILLFSIAQGRNSPHYIMTSYVSMDAVAALGWCSLLEWFKMMAKKETGQLVFAGGAAALILLQLASAMLFYPYYYVYSNPIMRLVTGQSPASDYGEGFEKAAEYLAKKPDSKSLKAFVYRARGPFSYFFPGETIILNLLFMEEPNMASVTERLAQADYLVFNEAMATRTERSRLFVGALNGVAPEHTISINGIYDIYIYRVADFPPSFYETITK